MPDREKSSTFAAVDLGSNSFHLLVARRSHGELRVLDRIKETVRLGGGLDEKGRIDADTRARAIECLARFGQRLRGLPADNIRAVGTQTFRRMRDARPFMAEAEAALECPIDIIGGREEARLIYLGVSQGVSGHEDRRLVIDIGGGSTELVIGEGLETLEMESLQFGCVSLTNWYFGNGKLSKKRWIKASRAVLAELQELQVRYRGLGWDSAIGSSGTIRAIAQVCHERGWCDRNITADSIEAMKEEVLLNRSMDDIGFPTLSERRRSVIAGGLVILSACFRALAIDEMAVSEFALREGVLHDLLGRLEHRDPRDKTVKAFRARYDVDPLQVERVQRTAVEAFRQIAPAFGLTGTHEQMLSWAAELHETGLSISHSHYQEHSGYLVERSDMAGFSRQEQLFLAALVRHHRRAVPSNFARDLPERLLAPLTRLLFCLRYAWVLCRTRDDQAIPDFDLSVRDGELFAQFDSDWLDSHPLTVTDMELECVQLKNLQIRYSFNRV
jgi:exopolyphosphatase/guanosine-5'-triphosphate,3'-diphosphate pyrophosphatase